MKKQTLSRATTAAVIALSLGGCATIKTHTPPPSPTLSTLDKTGYRCANATVAIDINFLAGNIASCQISMDGRIDITIASEDEPPINCSPWYAFRISPRRSETVTVTLKYTACGHRYWPKISADAVHWTPLPPKYMVQQKDKIALNSLKKKTEPGDPEEQAEFTLRLEAGKALFVSAQEIVTPTTYETWIAGLSHRNLVERFTLGLSAQQREISGFTLGNPSAKQQIVLIGRQHPPEVTGALALFPFVEALTEDTPLAQKFRAEFQVIVVPLVNPDGVVHGHWRHNSGGVDLNRDWGPFTQPETKLMEGLLKNIDKNPHQTLRLLLDFHSTQKDLFYTIPDEYPTTPPLFTRKWLAKYQQRMPGYIVHRDQNHDAASTVSKAYVYETYKVPAVTFEIGDETDRHLIRTIGRQSAAAMMELLIETKVK